MSGQRGINARGWQSATHRMLSVLLLLIGLADVLPAARFALADDGTPRPSVLVVDANVGDRAFVLQRWLGENTDMVAAKDGLSLYTTSDPEWWTNGAGTGSAPSSFVLTCDDGTAAIDGDGITWALDGIRLSGAEPRTFVVAMGTPGLRLREYVEDLADTKQSARADVVGMGYCGTPHVGYSAQQLFPESSLWETLARAAGLSVEDTAPDSAYLQKLNSGVFPAVSKSLNICGVVGDLGFGSTDGAATVFDFSLAPSVSSQLTTVQVPATIGQEVALSRFWLPFASGIDYPGREVDANLAERLSAMRGYGASEEVQSQVVEFYESWFAEGAPVTHNSSVLAIDLSGSMQDVIGGNTTKFDAAKRSAVEYLHAMQMCALLPQSAPMDVEVLGFSEQLERIATSYGDDSCRAVEKMGLNPIGETNIGVALDEALSVLANAPVCAKRHILLLSDGASTRGKSNAEMMKTCVATAKKKGISIDVVGFGDVGESNAGFLKKVTSATGGTYYEANDEYELKRNFLKTHYESLGLGLVDEEVSLKDSTTQVLGSADRRTSALMMGVVAEGKLPKMKLLHNGVVVDEGLYTVQTFENFASLQLLSPMQGEYSLELGGDKGRVHVFAVRQLGIPSEKVVAGEHQDWSLIILAVVGGVFALSVIVVLVISRQRAKVRA